MKTNNLAKGIGLVVISALCTSFGQLFWKIGVDKGFGLLILGFILYGCGALSLIVAFKFGKLSILHPIMCIGYVFALINGYIFLDEGISIKQLLGIAVIIIGVIFIARGEDNE